MKPVKIFLLNTLKALNIGLALLLAFAYLAIYTNPQHITLPAFGGLAYVYLLLANALMMIFWLFVRPKFALVSFIVIMLGWQHLGRFFQWNFPKETKGRSLKLISYNVRMFNRYNWDKTGNSMQRVQMYLQKEAADIVCLQEFYIKQPNIPQKVNAFQLGQGTVFSHVSQIAEARNAGVPLATFSAYPVVGRGSFRFYNSSNGWIYTDLSLHTDTIRVYNCHLQSVRFSSRISNYLNHLFEKGYNPGQVQKILSKLSKAYKKRALQITDLIGHIRNSPYPVIVCGDFNDTPYSYTYKQLVEYLHDGYMQAGRGLGNTYRTNLMPLRIDYLFYSDQFTAQSFRVDKQIQYSDHYPVKARLMFRLPKKADSLHPHSRRK